MVSHVSFATEERAGIVNTLLSALTERKTRGVPHSAATVGKVVRIAGKLS